MDIRLHVRQPRTFVTPDIHGMSPYHSRTDRVHVLGDLIA